MAPLSPPCLGLPLLLAAPALAQTSLSGPLSDATTGALTPGVYTATTISVPAGETLTVQPGVVVKFAFDGRFDVDGTLLVQGTSADPVVFTDQRDDSVGGDTNGDGSATAPAANWWRGIALSDGADASVLDHAVVRYGGRFISPLELSGCDAVFRDCEVSDTPQAGIDLNANSRPTLANVHVARVQGAPFDAVPLAAVPGFSGLTGADNALGNRLRVTEGTVPAGTSLVIGPDNGLDGTIHAATRIWVPATATLELGAGLNVKFAFDQRLDVDGELRVLGTPSERVTFTDERDDAVGGDTNGDGGTTSPAAFWWRGVLLTASASNSVLRGLDVRYGGRFLAGLEFAGCDASLEDVAVTDFANHGVDLNGSSRPTIDGLTVERCTGDALADVPIGALPGFSGLAASDNGNNWIDVTEGRVFAGEAFSIGPDNGIHGGFRVGGDVRIDAGAELTLRAGTIVKVRFDGRVDANGPLFARGTPSEPVRIVGERDDVGGDSNGDGAATVPALGWWRGVHLTDDADGSELEYLHVAHGGRFIAGILVDGVAARLDHCRVSEMTNAGIDLAATDAPFELDACEVQDCTGEAFDRLRLDRVPGLYRCRAFGNGNDRARVTVGTVAGDVEITPRNLVNRALYLAADVNVADGAVLGLESGVALQMAFDRRIDVNGGLRVRANLERPVIVTSETDTTIQLGAAGSGGASFYWRGILFAPSTTPSEVRGLVVRNGGRFIPNIVVSADDVTLVGVRSERSAQDGLRFTVAPLVAERIAAVDASTDGIQIDAPGGLYRQLTAVGNGGAGVQCASAFSGEIRDSISWGNTGAAFSVGAGSVRYSNGDAALAGSDGNIFADPLFEDEGARDLHLAAGSPSIDAGSPMSPLDANGTRADQGAYPENDLFPEVFCAQVDDAFCEPSISTFGFASMTSDDPFVVWLDDAPLDTIGLFFYGRGSRTQLAGVFGDICVTDPYYRTPVLNSGGDPAFGACDGRFEFDAREYVQSGVDPAVGPGVTLIGAFWYRDTTAPGGAKFSEAVEIPVGN